MKRLLAVVSLLILPVLATAQTREALLTPDGTLFRIESQVDQTATSGVPDSHLVLRSQRGEEVSVEQVPATVHNASNTEPAIAYDAESRTLFVFWLRHEGLMSSELLFTCRYPDGTWADAKAFGERFDYRENLRIAFTRKVAGEDGALTNGLSAHLVWWEFDTQDGTESARYAMVTIEGGKIASIDQLDLKQFTAGDSEAEPAPDVESNILKQPLVFASPKQDSVVIVFGDLEKRRMHEVRVTPTLPPVASEGRLRVPVGRQEGSGAGPQFVAAADGRIEGIYGDTDRMALYTRSGNKLHYVVMQDGSWTESRSIALDEDVTSAAAVDALRRLLNGH